MRFSQSPYAVAGRRPSRRRFSHRTVDGRVFPSIRRGSRARAGPPVAVRRLGHQSFAPSVQTLSGVLLAVRYRQDWMKASRSALIVSA